MTMGSGTDSQYRPGLSKPVGVRGRLMFIYSHAFEDCCLVFSINSGKQCLVLGHPTGDVDFENNCVLAAAWKRSPLLRSRDSVVFSFPPRAHLAGHSSCHCHPSHPGWQQHMGILSPPQFHLARFIPEPSPCQATESTGSLRASSSLGYL